MGTSYKNAGNCQREMNQILGISCACLMQCCCGPRLTTHAEESQKSDKGQWMDGVRVRVIVR